jgi:hypothetical protein
MAVVEPKGGKKKRRKMRSKKDVQRKLEEDKLIEL